MRHVEIRHVQVGPSTEDVGSHVTFELEGHETLYGFKDKHRTVTIICGYCQRKTFYHEATGIFQCGNCKRTYDVHGEPV